MAIAGAASRGWYEARQGGKGGAESSAKARFEQAREDAAASGFSDTPGGRDKGTASAAGAAAVPEKKELTAAQKKRRDLMKMMGKQMKTDLVKKEQTRIVETQHQQYMALDKQLRMAEDQRKARQRKQHEMLDQMRQDKLIRAMNVQSSAFANRIIHNEKDFSFKEN